MLVLSRKLYERIYFNVAIGDRVVKMSICPVQFLQGKVRIGIEAPPEVVIFRDDIKKGVKQNV